MQSLKTTIFLLTVLATLSPVAFAAYGDDNTSTSGPSVVTREAKTTDAVIEAKLQTAYSLNPELDRFNIRVAVNNDVVTLDGAVRTNIQKELAESIAREVEGVQDIKNNLVVDKNTRMGEKRMDFGQKTLDATITAMVKSKLLASPRTSGLDIKVTTVNNVVTLTGKVGSAAEKQHAGRLAVQTTGVSAVKNQLQVASNR